MPQKMVHPYQPSTLSSLADIQFNWPKVCFQTNNNKQYIKHKFKFIYIIAVDIALASCIYNQTICSPLIAYDEIVQRYILFWHANHRYTGQQFEDP